MAKMACTFQLEKFQNKILSHLLQYGDDHRYNIPLLAIFQHGLTVTEVKLMIKKLTDHIPEFKFRVGQQNGDYVLTESDHPIEIEVKDSHNDKTNLNYYVRQAHQKKFDLGNKPLSHFTLISHGDSIYLIAIFHHLIMDGISLDNIKYFLVDLVERRSNYKIQSPYSMLKPDVDASTIQGIDIPQASIEPGIQKYYTVECLSELMRMSAAANATLAEVLLCIYGYAIKAVLSADRVFVPHLSRNNIIELDSSGCLVNLLCMKIFHDSHISEDINSYREQFFLNTNEDFNTHTDPADGALFSFREIDTTVGNHAGISFISENELFNQFNLLAPNKIGISILFELKNGLGEPALEYALEYDSALFSPKEINEISHRIEHHIRAFCGQSHTSYLGMASSSKLPLSIQSPEIEAYAAPGIRYFTAEGDVFSYSSHEIRVLIEKYKIQLIDNQVHTLLICAAKSVDVISIILACYELQICYIPIDATMSKEKIALIREQCSANALVLGDKKSLSIEYCASERVIFEAQYVIYTSGSTGVPKGVKIERDAIFNLCQSMRRVLCFDSSLTALSYADFHFDMSVPDIYLPYFNEGEIIIFDSEKRSDSSFLAAIISSTSPSLFQCTPTTLGLFSSFQLRSLNIKNLILGGEKVSSRYTRDLLCNVDHLWNFYGPTEATVWCAYKEIQPAGSVDVEKCLDGYEVGIFHNGAPCNPYEIGEIYIRGPISPGYVDTQLNKNAFVTLTVDAIERTYYATGDFAEFIPDKGFRIIGRKDDQIKLNGVRIELGEVETAIESITGVQECTVLYDHEHNQLLALIVSTVFNENILSLAQEVEQILPENKRPNQFISVSKVPVNINGKKERRIEKIRAYFEQTPIANGSIAPVLSETNNLHKIAISIITKTLKLEESSTLDATFYQLGGSSFKAINIIQELRNIGVNVEIRELLESRKISHFVDRVMERLQ